MSLSSGKASGKTTSYTPCTKGLVWHAEHDERIAELEAEVERLKAQRDHWWELVERAKLLLPGWPPEGGGGRESGEEPPEAGCSEPAAANPAARKERA